jgi:CMP-N-acetylneuraminic acid synthetase
MSKVLGLITARGGSKSIPRKNIAPLGGRPMLAYTCDAALGSREVTRVVLSTDDEEIAETGRQCGVEVPFMRPPELALDNSSSISVARHAVEWLEKNDAFIPDIVLLLQPTSPLRRADHIDEALSKMKESGADTIVSVIEVPHRFSPYSVMQFKDGWLSDFWQSTLNFDRYRRQDMPVLYARNGPALLAAKTRVIMEENSFYGSRIAPFVMDRVESIDIDDQFDLEMAEWIISKRSGK